MASAQPESGGMTEEKGSFELGAPADSMRNIELPRMGNVDMRDRIESPSPNSDTPMSSAGAWAAVDTPQKKNGPMSAHALRESALLRESQVMRGNAEQPAQGLRSSKGSLRDSIATTKTAASSSNSSWYKWNPASPVRDRLSKTPLEIAREFFNSQITSTPRGGKGRAHQCPTTQMQAKSRRKKV